MTTTGRSSLERRERRLRDADGALEESGVDQRASPTQARSALERWEHVLNPAGNWPLFPTLHLPSLYDRLRDAGVETTCFSGHDEVFAACRENDITPPSLVADGARRVMQRLTDDADLNVDGGYLKLHGARRGVGR
jgi:hypothetical protein